MYVYIYRTKVHHQESIFSWIIHKILRLIILFRINYSIARKYDFAQSTLERTYLHKPTFSKIVLKSEKSLEVFGQ